MNPLIIELVETQIDGLDQTILMFEAQKLTAQEMINEADVAIAAATARRDALVEAIGSEPEEV